MAIQAGSHTLGPASGTLTVKTGRTGAAARAGHDLLIEVTSWSAGLQLGDDPADTHIELDADPGSLRVRESSGGVQPLGGGEQARIESTIDTDVLRGHRIAFRSTAAQPGAAAGSLHVRGELTLGGRSHPIAFDLALGDDGALSARAVVKQSDWGIKPYSALFGTLKVSDEVEVRVDARL